MKLDAGYDNEHMLFLLFKTGADSYAIPADRVRKVVPSVPLRACPGAPEYVAGLFNYQGTVTPVVDLRRVLTGSASAPLLSTRIVLVSYAGHESKERLLGLMAESVTQTVRKESAEFSQPGLASKDAPFLGAISCDDGQMTQCIHIERLLPREIETMLFAEIGEGVS
ncbi:MAG: chemotaxis-related protein WspB [Candidatus Hydrogenedentes bacterium]|nr:chemotaxis-related protein WspB [Candidatus Hydrogenedentota bacterium]